MVKPSKATMMGWGMDNPNLKRNSTCVDLVSAAMDQSKESCPQASSFKVVVFDATKKAWDLSAKESSKTIQSLKSQLAEANKVIEFYGAMSNVPISDIADAFRAGLSCSQQIFAYTGTAREYLQKHSGKVSE